MRILFLYVSLPHLSQSNVFNDLIREFAKQGHDVRVATPLNTDEEEGVKNEAGIKVLRFKTDQLTRNASNIQKGLAYIKFIFQSRRAIKKYFGKEKFDLIIAHSLPPEMGLVVKSLKKRYQAKFYLMLCEYIWQDSVSLGFFTKNSPICKYYQWLEKVTIQQAEYIGSPSQGNIAFAQKYYPWVKEKNIHILHYSQAPIELEIRDINVRAKYGLIGKFVAIYGGNVTIAQKIENVLDLAESCLNYEDIVFLLIGRGPKIDEVKTDAVNRGLSNIMFLDFMPQKEYDLLLSKCDVGLVSLNEKLVVPNIPSKTLSYFNLSIPVVASIDRNTDYGLYLEQAGAGLWSYAGDVEGFKENLLRLYHFPELKRKMGQNGNQFYQENMLPEKAYDAIINHIKRTDS